MVVQQISCRMDCYDCSADGAFLLHSGQVEVSYGLVSAGAESSQEVAVISEGTAKEFRDCECPVPHRDGLEHFFLEMQGEHERPLGLARGAEGTLIPPSVLLYLTGREVARGFKDRGLSGSVK
jgi:hypothetical protein